MLGRATIRLGICPHSSSYLRSANLCQLSVPQTTRLHPMVTVVSPFVDHQRGTVYLQCCDQDKTQIIWLGTRQSLNKNLPQTSPLRNDTVLQFSTTISNLSVLLSSQFTMADKSELPQPHDGGTDKVVYC